jgi:hypothetical protein
MRHSRWLQKLTAAALTAVTVTGGLWMNPGTALAQAGPMPVVATQQRTVITATITAIDLSTRHVTLSGPGGKAVTVHVADQVKNLGQLKVGDRVAATYYESLLISGRKASPGDNSVRAMSTSQVEDERGQGGGAAGMQRTVIVVAKVMALDKPNGLITLRGPMGNIRTFKVQNPSLLTHMTIGDDVVISYTEAWAVALAEVAPAASSLSSNRTQATTPSPSSSAPAPAAAPPPAPSSPPAPAAAPSPAPSSQPATITPPAAQSVTPQQAQTPAPISVPVLAGTQVGLTFADPVDAAKTTQGDKVRFTVTADVIVNRLIVIRQGTPLEGTVTKIKRPGGFDNTAAVTLGFLSVTAVDEKPLVLDEVVVEPPAKIFGGNVIVAPGGVVTARTKSDATVSVPAGTP